MLNDPAYNEFTYDWNAVFVRYCDGMAHSGIYIYISYHPYLIYTLITADICICCSGNLSEPVEYQGTKLWFRGFENIYSTFANLIKNNNLGQATDVILNGASGQSLSKLSNSCYVLCAVDMTLICITLMCCVVCSWRSRRISPRRQYG